MALNRQMIAIPKSLRGRSSVFTHQIVKAKSFVAYFGLPLIAKGKIKGVLEVFHRTPLEPKSGMAGFPEHAGWTGWPIH